MTSKKKRIPLHRTSVLLRLGVGLGSVKAGSGLIIGESAGVGVLFCQLGTGLNYYWHMGISGSKRKRNLQHKAMVHGGGGSFCLRVVLFLFDTEPAVA
ncbi:hypothetical protein F4778DRAFT_189604 [Xylariomycetidae sp. FL2044]|nr:hypothetical protein F4778DRAFT_189604 [Xylariomycetidae sp. FL2044]